METMMGVRRKSGLSSSFPSCRTAHQGLEVTSLTSPLPHNTLSCHAAAEEAEALNCTGTKCKSAVEPRPQLGLRELSVTPSEPCHCAGKELPSPMCWSTEYFTAHLPSIDFSQCVFKKSSLNPCDRNPHGSTSWRRCYSHTPFHTEAGKGM